MYAYIGLESVNADDTILLHLSVHAHAPHVFRESVDQPCNEAVYSVHVAKHTPTDQPAATGVHALTVEGNTSPVEVCYYLAEREVGHKVPDVEPNLGLPDRLVRWGGTTLSSHWLETVI